MKQLAVVVVVLAVAFANVSATSRQEINFQGQLTYSNGDPIDSTVAITFDIYAASSGGTSYWTETHSSVTVTDGVFDVVLGSTNALPDTLFANNASLWVESTVGSTVISPRVELTSVPWAFDAATLDGIDSSGFALNPHDHLGETWDNMGGTFGLTILNGDHGFIVNVDSTALRATGTVDGVAVIFGRNSTSGTLGLISGTDFGGITRGPSKVGAGGTQMGIQRFGSLGTEREGVYGSDMDIGIEGAIACAVEPQLTPAGMPMAAGVYGLALTPMSLGGEFYHPGGPSAPGAGDDIALLIGQGHLTAAGKNPGLSPTIPSPGFGPANVASMYFGGPVPWVAGSPTGAGVSSVLVPDLNATITTLVWVFPTMNPYPTGPSFPAGPPVGTWWIDQVLPGVGFVVASNANEVPNLPDFVYWLVN